MKTSVGGRESGACIGGCLLLALGLALALGALVWGALSTFQGALQMTSESPRFLGVPPTLAEQNTFRAKVNLMRQAWTAGETREFALSTADLNAWLWEADADRDLFTHVHLGLEEDWLVAYVSVPLGFMRTPPFLPNLNRRFFNGRVAARIAVERGELVVKNVDIEGNGKRLAWLFTGQSYRQAIADGLRQGIRTRLPGGDDLLLHLEGVRIANGLLYVKVQGDRS
ncbi:MAG TPA: hypothetical protein VGD78_16825 [Chthoniobacterales bacterium]